MDKLGKAILVKVVSLDELRHPVERDYRMLLGNGMVFSRKSIRYRNGKFRIINHIDGSRQFLTATEMMDKNITNIGVSIEHGAFYEEQQ